MDRVLTKIGKWNWDHSWSTAFVQPETTLGTSPQKAGPIRIKKSTLKSRTGKTRLPSRIAKILLQKPACAAALATGHPQTILQGPRSNRRNAIWKCLRRLHRCKGKSKDSILVCEQSWALPIPTCFGIGYICGKTESSKLFSSQL